MNNVVAIDGPSASGKSTVARALAGELGYLFVDSGSLYRGITWMALRDGVEISDEAMVSELVKKTGFDLYVLDGAVCFRVDGLDLGIELRTERINRNVSRVAAVPEVRRKVVGTLKGMIELGNLVIEGRDIATAVFPDAGHKFYLDATPEERARRRYAEMSKRDRVDEGEIMVSLKERDRTDQSRKTDPLRVAPGAEIVDTTGMNIDEVVAFLAERVRS